jgi:DNA polymerase III subunit beta
MKFRVGRDSFGEAVAWVARALPNRPVVPVLSGLQVQAADDMLTLSCFDYEVSARIRIDAEVAEPGSALVPGRLLAEITRSLPAAAVEVSSVADMVSLTCGSAEFTLVPLPIDEYPALPDPPPAAGTVDGGALAAAAAQVVPSASRDDTLPMLTGVCLEIDGQLMTLAATDRYRLAVSEISWAPASPDIKSAVLVPARTLADVARTMAPGVQVAISFGAGDGARGEAGAAAGMITFEGGSRRLTVRLIAGDFIKYRSRFPAGYGCQALLPAGPFLDAVRRVSLVAERASPVRLAFGPDGVLIEAHAEGRARAVESVPAEFSGDEREISFNPQYLLDGIAAAATPGAARRAGSPPAGGPAGDVDSAGSVADPGADTGRIKLEFTSPTKPALITWTTERAGPEDDQGERAAAAPRFRYLVVPLRAPARP